ncbi:MAG: Ldh family oxidoreductase [Patescibacteria group bacterium]|nr:Ldh family oxidoreductase [Patescibacteria group bacterium]
MKISLEELKKLSKKAIVKYGYTQSETEVILDMLMYAQLRGNNQGIIKLIGEGIPKSDQAKKPSIEKETESTALINCNSTMEALVMMEAVSMVVEKAKKQGIAIVGTHNGMGSSGAIGYWSRMIAKEGLIGITMSSYPFASIPPYGSYQPLFCTNPIAWGVPTKEQPIVLDMATAAMANYGLLEAKTAGVKLEEKLGFDKDGDETNDPAEIMKGATKPFDKGYKGAGLALMVQIIGGALVGADFNNNSDNDGNMVIAINPDYLIGMSQFVNEVEKIKTAMKASKKLEGVEEVLVPGERGDRIRKEIIQSKEIEVEDNLLAQLKKFVSEE